MKKMLLIIASFLVFACGDALLEDEELSGNYDPASRCVDLDWATDNPSWLHLDSDPIAYIIERECEGSCNYISEASYRFMGTHFQNCYNDSGDWAFDGLGSPMPTGKYRLIYTAKGVVERKGEEAYSMIGTYTTPELERIAE
ncbi:MAG: hypothetical protein LBV04_05410 [Deferribacteraceae bacterium]|jgi:hypothetical protein|nr:hypothetical protein [Deferribacteraceae bacterium]